ncbi:twin-arginine translocase TatA/TatE family subunit [Flavobacterium gelidilacus]|jgi:sec-independent protein translocase protein TatA|uniref:Sec-independent protein translocase subunit TatA/TatB n=1 Tax=Flavobacterium gelidilacus TaxID=206041 RepID=UPI00040414C4|nr:twin-arginine translocase TatA/TatE family subunit [Flavobacterium gelidilacus]
MFGIGGGELFFIILISIMIFGSKGIPDVARFLGKTMAQLKNASNEIKSEIQRSATESGVDVNSLTGGISDEIKKAKEGIAKAVNPMENIASDITTPIEKVKEDIENLSGPIKRQL